MMALYGFAYMAFHYLKNQRALGFPNLDENGNTMNVTSKYQFIATFMALGVIANLAPHYITLLAIRSPALMQSSAAPALRPHPGLGASGAVYGTMAICALAYPGTEINIIFLPMLPFKIGYGFPAICLLDAIGIARGWTRFGHMVHLTGAAAGAGTFLYGPAAWYWGQWILRGGRIEGESHKKSQRPWWRLF
jgi:rhomboid-like protein